MNASLTTADRGTYLRTMLVACLFSLVAVGLAANIADHQGAGGISGSGKAERTRAPSMPIPAPVLVAMSFPRNPM
jgi:hypothetical protein